MKNLVTFRSVRGKLTEEERKEQIKNGLVDMRLYDDNYVKNNIATIFERRTDLTFNVGDSVIIGFYKTTIKNRCHDFNLDREIYTGYDVWAEDKIK
jgi:hypothetical protein